ncbi:MAG: hypothetical protein R3B93_11750 [Bacteroidia bacterium]
MTGQVHYLKKTNHTYPSASLSLIVNEMFDMGKSVDLVKLRGGLATVGNDANPYQLFLFMEIWTVGKCYSPEQIRNYSHA